MFACRLQPFPYSATLDSSTLTRGVAVKKHHGQRITCQYPALDELRAKIELAYGFL